MASAIQSLVAAQTDTGRAATAITQEDIARLVPMPAVVAGHIYQLEGRVEHLSHSNGRIIAVVQGSQKKPYTQQIYLGVTGTGRRVITGQCNCPMGRNCKHIAAALFAYMADHPPLEADAEAPPPPAQLVAQLVPQVVPQVVPGPPAAPPVETLPPDVQVWLRNLETAQQEETDDYPANIRKRLLYVIGPDRYSGGIAISLASIEFRKDGSLAGAARAHDLQEFRNAAHQPKFLRPIDRTILPGLATWSSKEAAGEIPALLSRIIATGRARWGAWNGPVVTEGPPVTGEIGWTLADSGNQRPTLDLPPPLVPLRSASFWYANPSTGVIGPVTTDLPARLVRAILAAPAMPPALVVRVREEMTRRLPKAAAPLPREIAPPRLVRETMRPHLALIAGRVQLPSWAITPGSQPVQSPTASVIPLARLSFRYGPVAIQAGTLGESFVRDGELLTVRRDRNAEAQVLETLRARDLLSLQQQLGYVFPSHPHAHDFTTAHVDERTWIGVVLHAVPAFRAAGWEVVVADDFPLRVAEPDGDFIVSVDESSGIDWFDVELGVMVDGARVDLVPLLRRLLQIPGIREWMESGVASPDGEPFPLPLPDGRILRLDFSRLRRIIVPLLELFDAKPGNTDTAAPLRAPRSRATDLALLEDSGVPLAWSGGEALRALGRQLRGTEGIPPCAPPPGFTAVLRPYQADALAWLQMLARSGLAGVLADDMGLGKTVQTLAHIAVEQAEGRLDRPVLVVSPTSVVPTWSREAARFAPSLRVLVLHGPDRARDFAAIGRHDLVITSYPLLQRDHTILTAQSWHLVVLDEAQTIKNPAATTSKLARMFDARLRLCLSGTPLENHLGELWALFDFLMPGFLGTRQHFNARYRSPIEKAGNTERQAQLARRVAPFLLRRTKAAVAADLPPRTTITETVEFGEGQRAVYEGIRMAMQKRVRDAIAERGLERASIVILDALLKLRQACCDPRLLKLKSTKTTDTGSAKLSRLFELLPQMLEEGRRVLLFSQFTSMLDLIEPELQARGIAYVRLDGDTRDRERVIARFQDREVPLFLISLKAGGVGLTLTAADTVIHYDPWWNPAVEEQATDRAHRIGQDKPVFVHRLITLGTIEEKMEGLKAKKQALVAGILDNEAGSALTMTAADVEALFDS